MRRILSGLICLLLAVLPSAVFAESCKPVLAWDSKSLRSYVLTLASLDMTGVASYAQDFMNFTPATNIWKSQGFAEPQGATNMLYSDQTLGYGNPQPFSNAKKNLFYIAITDEDAPTVTIIPFRANLGKRISFTAMCDALGMMHGTGGSTNYLLYFRQGACNGSCG